jgi:hypothetical protein
MPAANARDQMMKSDKQVTTTRARPAELRAALYLRVSTGRQAEHDLSIPDQRQQLNPGVAVRAMR